MFSYAVNFEGLPLVKRYAEILLCALCFTLVPGELHASGMRSDSFYYMVAEYIYDKRTITPKLDGRIQVEGRGRSPSAFLEEQRLESIRKLKGRYS